MNKGRYKMKSWLVSFSVILTIFLVSLGNTAMAEDIAVVARDDFPEGSLDIYDVKNIYMGIKLFSGKTKLKPVDQRDRNPIKKVFLKKVLNLDPKEYESFWTIRTFGGIIPPPSKRTSKEVIFSVLGSEGSIGYVWRNEIKSEDLKVLLIIPVEK
jgi:hypothetical protein